MGWTSTRFEIVSIKEKFRARRKDLLGRPVKRSSTPAVCAAPALFRSPSLAESLVHQ
jgi:hypothetical protein